MNYTFIPKEEFDRIRTLDIDERKKLELFATMCRFNCYVEVKKAGSGHLGSSFSAMDVVVYLYLKELNTLEVGFDSPDRDVYFSSKGHDVPGLYAVLYALGVIDLDRLMKLRRLGGLDGHPEVRIPGIEANSGSLGMGISKGKGFAWAKNYRGSGGRVFVLTGDGEFQEGQIWESFQSAAHQKVTNLTVIIDRNKFQTDMLVDDVNSIEDLKTKVSSFGWEVLEMKGHDFEDIERTFEKIKSINDKPKFIVADTTKGKGLSFLERPYDKDGKKMYKWHAGAPDDEFFAKGVDELRSNIRILSAALGIESPEIRDYPTEPKAASGVSDELVKAAFGEALLEIAERRDDLIVLDGDLSADCKLRPFEEKYPDRFIENGIAEQDMVSCAGGLARAGLLPVVNTFASFLAARANEQIYNNACEETKIIYACHFSGIIPAGPGKSHQSVRDISLLGAIPNCEIMQPCNAAETKAIMNYCVDEAPGACAVRLVIGPSPRKIQLPEDYKLERGKGATLRDGKDAVLFGYGPVMLHEALVASEVLETIGFGLKVVNMPWLNRFDPNWLAEIVRPFDKIFVLEDHSNFGGLGDNMLHELKKVGAVDGKRFEKFGLDEYPECGTPPEVLGYHKLDGRSLAEGIVGKELPKDIKIEAKFTEDAPQ